MNDGRATIPVSSPQCDGTLHRSLLCAFLGSFRPGISKHRTHGKKGNAECAHPSSHHARAEQAQASLGQVYVRRCSPSSSRQMARTSGCIMRPWWCVLRSNHLPEQCHSRRWLPARHCPSYRGAASTLALCLAPSPASPRPGCPPACHPRIPSVPRIPLSLWSAASLGVARIRKQRNTSRHKRRRGDALADAYVAWDDAGLV